MENLDDNEDANSIETDDIDHEVEIMGNLLDDVNHLLATVPNYHPNHTDTNSMTSLARFDIMDDLSEMYANVAANLPAVNLSDTVSLMSIVTANSNDIPSIPSEHSSDVVETFRTATPRLSASTTMWSLGVLESISASSPLSSTESEGLQPHTMTRSAAESPQTIVNEFTPTRPRCIQITPPSTSESPGVVLESSLSTDSIRDSTGAISIQLLLDRVRRSNVIVGNSLSGADLNQRINTLTNTLPEWIRINREGTSSRSSVNEEAEVDNPEDDSMAAMREFSINNWPKRWNTLKKSDPTSKPKLDDSGNMFDDLDDVMSTETEDDSTEDATAPSSSFMPWNVININRVSMLVDASDATVSSVVADMLKNDTQLNETQGQPRKMKHSSPVAGSDVSIGDYFDDFHSTDTASLEGDAARSVRNTEVDSSKRIINEDPANPMSPSSISDTQEIKIVTTSTDLANPLEDGTVVQTLEVATTDAMSEENKETARPKDLLDSHTTPAPLPQTKSSTSSSDEDDL